MAAPYPLVEVAVVLILDSKGERLLADYSEPWGCFTLPESKRRKMPAATEGDTRSMESVQAAAIRAAVEVLGRPLPPAKWPRPVPADVPPWNRSKRDGKWKRYQYHIFAMTVDFEPRSLPGHIAVWQTPKEFESGAPMSETALKALAAVAWKEVQKAAGL